LLASAGIARATAYRHLKAFERRTIAAMVVPGNVIEMVRNTGVLNLEKPETQAALQEAVYEHGKVENPAQVMSVVSRACEIAEANEHKEPTLQEQYIAMLKKAIAFAKDHNLPYDKVDEQFTIVLEALEGPRPKITSRR
jgi:hypothetical protein